MKLHTRDHLAARLERACGKHPVPLLLLRMPQGGALEFETVEAFADAAARVVRSGDLLAHDPGSDWFALAMLAPARGAGPALSLDARAALERIAATMSLVTGKRMETGWWPVTPDDFRQFERTVERALERGARERERFEFLATVGHELRTPLTSIRGYLETVLDDGLDVATTRRFLEVARDQALRLGRLLDGILDFAPLDASPLLAAGTTDLSASVGAAIDALEPIAREAGVSLITAQCTPAPARIAHDACMHILLNVIENAIKYGHDGGEVVVSLERQDPFVCLVVDDDGPGIAGNERERIFEQGERGGAADTRSGLGLGLAIVRSIVERAAGTVTACASPLGGARFVIRLPMAKADSLGEAS